MKPTLLGYLVGQVLILGYKVLMTYAQSAKLRGKVNRPFPLHSSP